MGIKEQFWVEKPLNNGFFGSLLMALKGSFCEFRHGACYTIRQPMPPHTYTHRFGAGTGDKRILFWPETSYPIACSRGFFFAFFQILLIVPFSLSDLIDNFGKND
jgi:hypothetical protein